MGLFTDWYGKNQTKDKQKHFLTFVEKDGALRGRARTTCCRHPTFVALSELCDRRYGRGKATFALSNALRSLGLPCGLPLDQSGLALDLPTAAAALDAAYTRVMTVRRQHVDTPKSVKGFHFYAAKDREMAREADFGLMIWDGKSPGALLNVMRLVTAGKIAVLFNVPDKDVLNIKSLEMWKAFFSRCDRALQSDVQERATPEEWRLAGSEDQPSFLPSLEAPASSPLATPAPPSEPTLEPVGPTAIDDVIQALNHALAEGDATSVTDTLGLIARERGMSQVARETGLARESLYRALDAKGNPEFATVLKVLASIGLRLEAKADSSPPPRRGAEHSRRRP